MAIAEETLEAPPVRTVDVRQVLFFAYVGIALVLFTFLPPPFQKPDEPAHYYRSVSLTNLDFVCSRGPDSVYGFQMKRKYTDLPDALHVWDVALLRTESRFNTDWLDVDFLNGPEYQGEVGAHDICNLAPPGYVPSALGVLLGKPFPNMLVSFYLARVFGALFFAGMLFWALRVTPAAFRLPVYFYAALPMVLFQVSAINYDAVQLSLFPLIYAYLTRFAVQDEPIRRWDLLIFLAALWWAVNTRTLSYAPLLLLFFAVRPALIAPDRRRYLTIAGGFFAVCLLSLVLVGLLYISKLGPPANELYVDANDQLRYVLDDPTRLVAASYGTLKHYGDQLLMEAVGVFGWGDTYLAPIVYYLFAGLGAAVLYRAIDRDALVLPPRQVAVILGVVVLTAASLFVSLYLIWTPVGADRVEGVQGRYLVGLVPLAIFGISQAAGFVGKRRLLDGLLLLLVPFVLYNLYRAIDLRYYG